MIKSGIDQDALIDMFAEASAKQGDKLRKAVADATLKALQGRELTLENVRKVIKTVTQAASAGAEKNPASAGDVEHDRVEVLQHLRRRLARGTIQAKDS